MQVNVGMGTKVQMVKTKKKEKGNLTRKEKIPKEKRKKENLTKRKNAVYVATNTLSKTAGLT